MKFQKENLNPFGKKTSDCAIRAISKGLQINWYVVADDLYKLGRDLGCTQCAKETIKKYLDGYINDTCKSEKGKKRKKVSDFEDGVYILKLANHMTTVVYGVCYDLWDCRERCVYRYWKVK